MIALATAVCCVAALVSWGMSASHDYDAEQEGAVWQRRMEEEGIHDSRLALRIKHHRDKAEGWRLLSGLFGYPAAVLIVLLVVGAVT